MLLFRFVISKSKILNIFTFAIKSIDLYNSIHSYVICFRCATGEAWPDIMLDATSGRECDPLAVNYNETTGTKA